MMFGQKTSLHDVQFRH